MMVVGQGPGKRGRGVMRRLMFVAAVGRYAIREHSSDGAEFLPFR